MYYVYELRDTHNVIVYIGCTNNPEKRLYYHIKCRPQKRSGIGRFYGQNDLTLSIVKEFDNRQDALLFEGDHKLLNGFVWTERIGIESLTKELRSNGGKLGGKINGKIAGNIVNTCEYCGRQIKGRAGYHAHLKKCKHDHDRARNRSEAFGF